MAEKPNDREQHLMTVLGCKTLEELEEFLSRPMDPTMLEHIEPVYPDDYPDLEAEDPYVSQ